VQEQFVIDLHEVPERESRCTFAIAPAWCREAFAECDVAPTEEAGVLSVDVMRTGPEVLVRGTVRLTLATTCVRCLKPTPVTIDTSFAALYVPGAVPERDDDEEASPDEGPDVESYEGSRIVLDPYVRDTVLLEVPMNPKCQVDCRAPGRANGAS
jgi:uncharacterized protein